MVQSFYPLPDREPHNYRSDSNYMRIYGEAIYQFNKGDMDNIGFINWLWRAGLAIVPDFMLCYPTTMRFGDYMPMICPPPKEYPTTYVYPSHIHWRDEYSFIPFFGSTEILELPRDVLRETSGHPQIRPEQMRINRLRIPGGWEPQSVLDVAGRDKRLFW